MAAQDFQTKATGADTQGGLRQRYAPPQQQQNGNYVPKELDDKLDKKTKQQVSIFAGTC